MAARRGAVLPVVESTLHEYQELIARGFGDEDIAAIYRLKSALFPESPPVPT
jgi:3-hydroxyisobutyrate dehydrogenase-like beta-hydroxyacid dehydrogenase